MKPVRPERPRREWVFQGRGPFGPLRRLHPVVLRVILAILLLAAFLIHARRWMPRKPPSLSRPPVSAPAGR